MRNKQRKTRRLVKALIALSLFAALIVATGTWLANRAMTIKTELDLTALLVPQLKGAIEDNNPALAMDTVKSMTKHTSAARAAGNDPLWLMARSLPIVGINFTAVSEVATTADDVSRLGAGPLTQAFQALDWDALLPNGEGTDLKPLRDAAPSVASSAYAVRASSERLAAIDSSRLLPQVAAPLKAATEQLTEAVDALSSAADASAIAPIMLGSDGPKRYLLMVQNNAEARASGGIPGALAILTVDSGKLAIESQTSASALGTMSPVLPVDPEQRLIYSTRVGKFMQDVNLTPDFPTSAATAMTMWEKKKGERVDGVVSVDPVVLSYILQATGPVAVDGEQVAAVEAAGLPADLTSSTVVPTLLSDVYAKIEDPALQDIYFAGVAKEVFSALAGGKGESRNLIAGLIRGAQEGRVLLWSADSAEQSVLAKYPLSGSVVGPSVAPAQFGVYFNDGTGAKMDYYIKRTVQLLKACPKDGYEEVTVRVTSTNTAPKDAATSLPAYVTGDGIFGIPAGSVQTNVIAYGPVQAQIELAKVDGKKTNFAPYLHSNRPVGVLAIRLAPGESKTVEYTFGKIVQHTEPDVVVTPTVQPVKDVILPTVPASCG